MHCKYCGGEHARAQETRACWERRTNKQSVQDQVRQHGLAAAGLSKAPANKAARAAELRAGQTVSERQLGEALLAIRPRLLPQQVVFGYIADFFSADAMLAVEVDGSSHQGRNTADRLRDDALRVEGVEVLRFTVDEVRHYLDRVVSTVERVARARTGRGHRVLAMELD